MQLESALWRPFWQKVQKNFPQLSDRSENVIGEATGGDQALVSSLPGFEDLMLIGQLQMSAQGITREDVVVAMTEGGETSSVIGTILAAADLHQPESKGTGALNPQDHLFFFTITLTAACSNSSATSSFYKTHALPRSGFLPAHRPSQAPPAGRRSPSVFTWWELRWSKPCKATSKKNSPPAN